MDKYAKVVRARLVVAQLVVVMGFGQAGCTLTRTGTGASGSGGSGTGGTGTGGTEDLCGDGVIDASEQCDGSQLGGQDCASLGMPSGELACDDQCAFDTSGCTCGNGVIDGQEQCDGVELGGQDCAALSLPTGELACGEQCSFDTTGCTCGNGVIDGQEQCDGAELGGRDCASQGLEPGTLACDQDCQLDLSGCPGCGNGIVEADELCDGSDFGSLSCNGDLQCTADCLVDASGCALPSSGDGSDGPLIVSDTHSLNQGLAPSFVVTGIGADRVQVASDASTLALGDEMILINMQGSTQSCGSVGNYEFLQVSSATASEVVFSAAVQGGYGVGGNNADLTDQQVVLQRVPQFTTVTVTSTGVLTVDDWDGTRGGLLVMRVSQQLTVDAGGTVDLTGKGYRGAYGYNDNGKEHGRQGESTCGHPHAATTLPNFGGGGGGKYTDQGLLGDGCGQGGGGAGYGQPGTWKPYVQNCMDEGNNNPAHNNGSDYGTADLAKLMMGSGGGSGATDDNSGYSGGGGDGGGMALIFAASASIAGTLSVRGMDGLNAPHDHSDSGNGGGGSGGAVHLLARGLAGTGAITAEGGLGPPPQGSWNNPGGDGGVGRLRVDYQLADGHLLGSAGADGFLTTMASPEVGHSELYLQ